jgi:hypothetical protein
VFINSNNPECALITNGNGSIRIDGEGKISVVGGARIQKPKLLTPYPPQTNASPISYPPPFFMPKVGCAGRTAEILGDGVTMSPGNYNDSIFPPEGVQFLESGVYCIKGDFVLESGSLQGNNVTFVMEYGAIKWNSSFIDLSAPQSGDNAGLLIFAPIENKSIMRINSNSDSKLRGTILMPGAEIHLNGGDSQYGYSSQIIGYRIQSNGQSNIVIKYKDEQNFRHLLDARDPTHQIIKFLRFKYPSKNLRSADFSLQF